MCRGEGLGNGSCRRAHQPVRRQVLTSSFFFFKQKTAYEIGLGIPAEPLFRSALRGQICHCEHFHPEVAAHSDSEQLLRDENRSEERFSRNAETDLVCRLLLEKKTCGDSKSQRSPAAKRKRTRASRAPAARAVRG